MISSYMGQLKNVMMSGIQEFIGPSSLLCTWCRAIPQYKGLNPLHLCDGCFKSIPWIKEIHCPVCGRYEACPDCVRREAPPLTMNRSAVEYDDGMKDLLALYKYRGDERLRLLLGRMLVHGYRKFPAGLRFDCVSFVPLSPDRYAERGFNQAEQMARELSSVVKLPVISLLKRVRHTDKQSFKTRHERLRDLSGAFSVDDSRVVKLQRVFGQKRRIRILVVDDVYTTGSTLNQCALVIREALPQAQIYSLCWAR